MVPTSASTLPEWLEHCQRLHVREVDLSLERTAEVRRRLQLGFSVPLIIVAGTNGKGSTCAMLESIAQRCGYRVGVYAKPHLVDFEERCRIDGRPVDAAALVPHFAAVEAARGEISLSFFEFTTLAIARCLAQAPLDLVVLEVGLGGRFDAVNAFDGDCSIITSIDLDHMEFLGPDRESIGREKAGIMRAGRPVVCSDPVPPTTIAATAAAVGADLRQLGRDFRFSGDRLQWNWSGRQKRFSGLGYPALRGANQLQNAAGVLAAFEALSDRLPITAAGVREGFALVDLPGRFQVLPGTPPVVLDVAHNPHAAAALAESLDQMGFYPETHAVFGAMADKDIEGICRRMAPVVTRWYLTDLPVPRAADAQALLARLRDVAPAAPATLHAGPLEALAAARAAAGAADRIVVFGSFLSVGPVLRALRESRTTPGSRGAGPSSGG